MLTRRCLLAVFFLLLASPAFAADTHRLLYVASPGVRNDLQYGGHGLLVFDIDNNHKFVKRIPTAGLDAKGIPLNVKGVCANAATGRIYISTLKTLIAVDLISEKVVWEKPYEGGCDRMSISPDGKVMYLPSLEGNHWHVVDAMSGDVLAKVTPNSGAHNTVYASDGKFAYLAGLRSNLLTVADTSTHTIAHTVGPFSASIRPFTVNHARTLAYCCVNDLLGFEIGDLATHKMIQRVEVEGFKKGPVQRHGCPSHGIGLTPDEKEVWVTDATNKRLHVFDNTVMPPKQLQSIELRDEPGWVTFTIDGQYAYPSTGDVVDVKTRKVVTTLEDETGRHVQSEKLLEIDFVDGKPSVAGDQFGVGRANAAKASIEGVYLTSMESSRYSGTRLELKGGQFRYWFYTDAIDIVNGKRIVEDYPLTGKYEVKSGSLLLHNERISGEDKWHPDVINGIPVLLRGDALNAWKRGHKVYDYGVLIKADSKEADPENIQRPTVGVLYDEETRKRIKEWKDPFINGPQ